MKRREMIGLAGSALALVGIGASVAPEPAEGLALTAAEIDGILEAERERIQLGLARQLASWEAQPPAVTSWQRLRRGN